MKHIFYAKLLLMIGLISNSLFSQEIHCKLRGNVIGENSKFLILVNERENPSHNGVKIPIIGGHFEYELKTSFAEKYSLIFENELDAYRPISFFTENGIVEFLLHPSQEFDKNIIKGGMLTNKMIAFEKEQKNIFNSKAKPFKRELDTLWNSNGYFSEAVNALYEKGKGLENGEELNRLYKMRDELLETDKGYTPKTWLLKNKMDSIQKIVFDWQNKYIKTNQDIFSYSLLQNTVQQYKQVKKNIDLDFISNLFSIYSKKYPLHPYTKQIREMLNGIKTIKVGSQFIDFSAPTIEGKVVKVSEIVAGKVAVIDMWASWCGSCRVTSKSYIPVYEKYKDKGFVIVGVAGEYKNTNAFKIAIEKDKYPWLSLIELDNENGIWNKYNISNSGGSTYLVDSKGVILAINPNAEQLEKFLGELL
ncbi:AhpC/TSA family protein [Flavobacterium rhamnosiphilum]|uniref:AhpC/TSA family protein n=1 Tax=Flavobacterium rhamnosiphilum TaxID=2541724 RepID=A0A4R5FBY9_9FLAO|nr:TlpA disulfide reductase family protein [Flavobacterium rhamnosiphilum]TDE45954.1 AhpC/TSA family protein [Flavobacterium rhamnosiphilum]